MTALHIVHVDSPANGLLLCYLDPDWPSLLPSPFIVSLDSQSGAIGPMFVLIDYCLANARTVLFLLVKRYSWLQIYMFIRVPFQLTRE